MNATLLITGTLLSALASIISGLVLANLSSLNKRMNRLEDEQKKLTQRKANCQNEFVSSGQWVREAGYTRQRLDETVTLVQQLSAKVDIQSQLPKFAAEIAAATVTEIFKRKDDERKD